MWTYKLYLQTKIQKNMYKMSIYIYISNDVTSKMTPIFG